ncbi:MAG: ATP-binding protein [Propionibacteriaceae bacterium]|nr:ATP-binding protein [Propionibacteriaceae bacterium]
MAAAVLTLNFESLALADVDSAQALDARVRAHDFPAGKRYVLLDEVQLVPQWERAVNSLRLDDRYDLYLTGSNSRLLSSELASLLSRRYVPIEVFPLSFREFVAFDDRTDSYAAQFNDYLRFGGLPGQCGLRGNERVWSQNVDAVLNTIITKDIVAQREVRDVDALLKIVRFLAANVGNLLTAKRVADYLASTGRRVTSDTVDNYLALLEEAYLFYRVKREDLRGRSTMKTNDKFYVVDLGFRAVTYGLGTTDLGSQLENIVYFELRRRYEKVSVGKYGAEAVDFVAYSPQGLAYFQVTATMNDDATRERELRPLRSLRDAYPKTVLSLDEIRTPDFDGIAHHNLVDWLQHG